MLYNAKNAVLSRLMIIAFALASSLCFAKVFASEQVVLALISGKPNKHIRHSQELATYLAEQVYPSSNAKGVVKVATDMNQLVGWFLNGEVDIATETVFAAIKLQRMANVEFIARRWKKGVAEYQSIFITHQDSGVENLTDLNGKMLLFEDKSSTSGFYIPASLMIHRGLSLQYIDNFSTPIKPDHVGVLFASEHLNTSSEINITAWVYQQKAAAGAYSSIDWKDPKHAPPAMRKKLKIFESSSPFPRSLMVVRDTLPADVKARMKQALLQADQSEQGRSALVRYQKTKKFDALDDSTLRSIDEARALLDIVENNL